MKTWMEWVRNRFARINREPIIVLGNQKSGTSAIAHLLADYGGLSKCIDIPPLWSAAHGIAIMRGEASFSRIVEENPVFFSKQLIKEPMMTFFTREVLRFFPKATYLFIIRDPRSNIRSLLNSRKIAGHLAQLPPELLPTNPHHKNVADPYIWGGYGENYVGILAHRWNLAVDNYLPYQDHFHLVRYEDFILDKVGFIHKLAKDLGVQLSHSIADKVDIQYQPRGNRDIAWEAFFGQDNLRRIERICGSHMALFAYRPADIGEAR